MFAHAERPARHTYAARIDPVSLSWQVLLREDGERTSPTIPSQISVIVPKMWLVDAKGKIYVVD